MPELRDKEGLPILSRPGDARWDHARMFTAAKGRLPADRAEFVAWLVEYSNYQEDLLARTMKVYEDHLRTCNRPLIITKAGFLSKD